VGSAVQPCVWKPLRNSAKPPPRMLGRLRSRGVLPPLTAAQQCVPAFSPCNEFDREAVSLTGSRLYVQVR
jgi:hypothetical protein